MLSGLFFTNSFDVYREKQGVLAATGEGSSNQTDVSIVTTQGQRQVAPACDMIVGGINVEPCVVEAVNGYPCVGGIATKEPLLTRRRFGAQVAAHVPRRQAQRSKATDFKMRKILANPAATADTSERGVETLVAVLSNLKSA